MNELAYKAPPTVARFMKSDARVRLIVGPVGSGKSSGCNMEFLHRAGMQRPGPDGIRRTRWVAIRNTYRELKDTTRVTFSEWLGDKLEESGGGGWHEQDFTYEISMGDVQAEILFRALDSAKDVKKLLSLELTGAYINEAREVPRAILDGLKARVGRYPSRKDGGASWSGIWMDTNPMHTGHELYQLFKKVRPRAHELFEQPSGFAPDAENVENLPAGYYSDISDGQDEEWVDEYVRAKYPKRDKGSVYGDLLSRLEEAGAMGRDFTHPRDGVFAVFDLGVSDATSIWWFRSNGDGLDLLDFHEAVGKSALHYFEELDKRERAYGWELKRIVLPHDARARTFQTGATTQDLFIQRYPGLIEVLPPVSLEDGIGAGRHLLERATRFHPRTEPGLVRLRAYRFEFDVDRRVFGRKPVHDWTSHAADAFRYAALYTKRAGLLSRKPEPPKQPNAVPYHRSMTLDELWESNERQS